MMLGIGEVWYFCGEEAIFSQNDHFIMVPDQQHVLLVMNTNSPMMLGIGEVCYFHGKEGVFSQSDNSIVVPDQQHLYFQ